MTLRLKLAAPNLTRLLLINHFRNVEGLQDCTKLQQLQLEGCSITLCRLAQLVSALPSLSDFWWFGENSPGKAHRMRLEQPVLWAPVKEQRQLAAALSGATQLTSFFILGRFGDGYAKVEDGGRGGLQQAWSSEEG